MDFDFSIVDGTLHIYCSNSLKNFSYDFIKYYNEHIADIRSFFNLDKEICVIVALVDDFDILGSVYEKTDFSGYFNDTGAIAYINENGKYTKEYLFKALMHEITHYFYKYYVYGQDKKRIVWVDEGLAQLVSGQKDYLNDKSIFVDFLNANLKESIDLNLNLLNHDDRSFGNNNGYKLSYIAIRYLFDTNEKNDFLNIIKDEKLLTGVGNNVLRDAWNYYSFYYNIS